MLDYIGLAAYVALMAYVAFYTRRTPRFAEFSLANKRLPWFLIFASLSSTYIGPGFSIGAAEKGFTTGFYSYFLFLPFALQTILVGLFLAPRLAALDGCASIGDVFAQKYNRFGQLLAGVSSVGICVMFTAFLAKVAGELIEHFLGVPFVVGVVVVTTLSLSYTFFGGMKASVLTDAIQFAVFAIMIPLIPLLAISGNGADPQAIAAVAFEKTRAAWQNDSLWGILGVSLSFLLGETLIPPYANRALASASPGASRNSFLVGGFFCVVWLAVVTGIGLCANSIAPDASDAFFDVARPVLPLGLWGMLIAAIIGILMSSQDSVLNAGAVSLTRDLAGPFARMDDHTSVAVGRAATVLIALLGAISAGFLPGIIDALLLIYSIWAPTVLIPLVLALLLKRTPAHSGWLSIVSGGTCSIAWQTILKEPGGVPAILPGMAAALLGFAVGYLFGRTGPQFHTGHNTI